MIDLRKLSVGTKVIVETESFMYQMTVLGPGPGNSVEVQVETGDPDFRHCWMSIEYTGCIVLDFTMGTGSKEYLTQVVPYGRMVFHRNQRVIQTRPTLSAVVVGDDYEYEVFKV